MKQIDVDFDVFSRIWVERKDNEFSENDVLRRLLLGERGTGQQSPNVLMPGGAESETLQHIAEYKEVKTSNGKTESDVEKGELEVGKIRWVDDIRTVLRLLGGQADLHTIYKEVEKRRRSRWVIWNG